MTNRQLEQLRDAQAALEAMPVGGIGIDGASQFELDIIAARGDACFGDANYHQAQQAWLLIERAIKGEA